MDDLTKPHISEPTSVSEGMEHSLTQIAELLDGAATALSNQWSEDWTKRLTDLAQTFRGKDVGCCGNSMGKITFAEGKDGTYIHCRNCGSGLGSPAGVLIANALFKKENHKFFYENAHLSNQTTTLSNRVVELEAEVGRLRDALEPFVDDDPCHFDHHGFCQLHGGGSDEDQRCRNTVAQAALQVDTASPKEESCQITKK